MSDSHLSPTAPFADDNWQAVLDHLDQDPPALVIHTGDISLNGADHVGDLEHARRQLDRIRVPWLAIPGNHDIGDLGETSQPVTAARRDRYAEVFGDDRWSTRIDGWHLIGLDVQTLASDLPASTELWDWFADHLDDRDPTAVWIHRPLQPWAAGEIDDPNRYLPAAVRHRLSALMARADVRLIGTGHVHQWRLVGEGTTHVWAPSTWASLPDRIQPVIGAKTVGIVEHELRFTDGEASVSSVLVRPRAIADVIIGDDFLSPYTH